MVATAITFVQTLAEVGREIHRLVKLATENDKRADEFLRKMERIRDVANDLKEVESEKIRAAVVEINDAIKIFRDFVYEYKIANAKAEQQAQQKGFFKIKSKAKKVVKVFKAEEVQVNLEKLDKVIEAARKNLDEAQQAFQTKKIAELHAEAKAEKVQREEERRKAEADRQQMLMLLRMNLEARAPAPMSSPTTSPTSPLSAQMSMCGRVAPPMDVTMGGMSPTYPTQSMSMPAPPISPSFPMGFPYSAGQMGTAGYSLVSSPTQTSPTYQQPMVSDARPTQAPPGGAPFTPASVSISPAPQLSSSAAMQTMMRPMRDEYKEQTLTRSLHSEPAMPVRKMEDEHKVSSYSARPAVAPAARDRDECKESVVGPKPTVSYAAKRLPPIDAKGHLTVDWAFPIEVNWTKPNESCRQQLMNQGYPDPFGTGRIEGTNYNTLFKKLNKSGMPAEKREIFYKNYSPIR